jgi:hypothetical protein
MGEDIKPRRIGKPGGGRPITRKPEPLWKSFKAFFQRLKAKLFGISE